MRRTANLVDEFQAKLSLPLAARVASYCRAPLIGVRDFLRYRVALEAWKGANEPKFNPNLLQVVLGPFNDPEEGGVIHDQTYTYWHGVRVYVGFFLVEACLCRLNPNGTGGIYSVKLFYNPSLNVSRKKLPRRYVVHGDPEQQRDINPKWVLRIMCEHMTAQYHVGFVEDKKAALHREGLIVAANSLQRNHIILGGK